MSNKLDVAACWLAICGLWLLIAITYLPSVALRLLGSGGLAVAEWAHDQILNLRDRVRG